MTEGQHLQVKAVLSTPFTASFLAMILKPGTGIAHLTLVLIKVFFFVSLSFSDSCSVWCSVGTVVSGFSCLAMLFCFLSIIFNNHLNIC